MKKIALAAVTAIMVLGCEGLNNLGADTRCDCETYEDGSQKCYCKDLNSVYQELDAPNRIIYEEADGLATIDTEDGSYGAIVYYGTEGKK